MTSSHLGGLERSLQVTSCHLRELQVTSCQLMEIWSQLGTTTIQKVNDGLSAGDTMPPEWRCMTCIDVWRGNQKGQVRPSIDIKLVRQMLERRGYCPERRYNDDRAANNGVSKLLLDEYRQLYIKMHWKHENGAPCVFCCLCEMKPGATATFFFPPNIWTTSHFGHTRGNTTGLMCQV